MAEMCNAVLLSEEPDYLGRILLTCDLAKHDLALNMHYDRKLDTEWRKGHTPSAVPYRPTGPQKKLEVAIL
jgi:hypothetical protein